MFPNTLYAIPFVLAALPALAADVTIDTYRGEMTVAENPETIAVFDMAALDTLEALGVETQATIENVYLAYLEDAAAGTVRVGSLFEPDYEALNALQPDLIIAGGRSYDAVPDLAKMAPTIDMTIWEDTIGQALDRLEAFGQIFDKTNEAEALRAEFDAKLAQVRAAADSQGKTMIVMTNGPKVSAYGAAGRFGWLHTAFGLQEAVADVEEVTHGEAISFEFIRDANPDLLLVIDRSAAIGKPGSAKATLDNALVREVPAWKNGKVVYLPSAEIYIAGGGIQSLNGTMDALLAAFGGS